jgi:hypothetical protein
MRSLINPKLQASLLRNSLPILVSPRTHTPKHFQAVLLASNIRHAILLRSQARRGGLERGLEATCSVPIDRSVCNRRRVVAVTVVILDLAAETFDGRGGARTGWRLRKRLGRRPGMRRQLMRHWRRGGWRRPPSSGSMECA